MIPVARPLLGEKEIAAATGVLRSGQVVQGRQVAEFEAEFAALVAGRHCVAVSSGTAALWLSLLALGIGRGDEVIVPSWRRRGYYVTRSSAG
ncbi:MAG: DegT/DnrJ/EryC1/StrS family aminotransferase [Streptosporangiaceae bacterium]